MVWKEEVAAGGGAVGGAVGGACETATGVGGGALVDAVAAIGG